MSGHRRPSPARRLPWLGTAALLVALTLPATAGELYQWKDANGVTHYSDAPPPGKTEYRNRNIRNNAGTPATAAAPVEPAESEACTQARANLALLQGDGPVAADDDGDGKPDGELDADQRADRSELAAAAIKVHCGSGDTPAAGQARS
jgi:hypothetical protein